MSTTRNCLEILKEVREGIGEYSDSLALGDEVGAYRNEYLIRLVNRAIRQLHALIAKRQPGLFTRDATLTGVDSVFTLPPNYGKMVLFRDFDGRQVFEIKAVQRRMTSETGYTNEYYQSGNTLIVNRPGIVGPYTLIYEALPRDIHQGKASAGGALSMTLDRAWAPKTASYYVGMTVENITQDWVDVITAYTTARVATIAQTAAANDFYAIAPDLPEWSHILIGPMAIIAAKSSEISKEKPTKAEKDEFAEMLINTFRQFCTPNADESVEDMFSFQGPRSYGASLF